MLTLFVFDLAKVFWKKSEGERKKLISSDMRHPISLYAFGSVWILLMKLGYFFLRKKLERTHFKLSQAASF
jgi:hypothetical protein